MSRVADWFRRAEPARPASTAAAPAAPASPEPAAESTDRTDDAAVGRMLDATGALVRLVGAYAHDTDARSADDARREADRWRKHLTTGLGHPASGAGESAGVGRGGGLGARDWEGAVKYATADRHAEHAYVARSLGELRTTVWTLVRGLHEVMGAEAEAAGVSASSVRRLKTVVEETDPERLREAALVVVGELGSLLARREQERERQIANLGREVAALGAALEEARREGCTDPLTGLGNRRAFDAALAHAVALHGLWGQPVCLLLADVDLLKQLNDTAGHAAGDAALQRVASQLSRTFLRRTDVVARIGGDEFAVLARDLTLDEAVRLGERLAVGVRASERPPGAADPGPAVGVSVGVAALQAGESPDAWMARADAALYAAKRAGRGGVSRAS